MTQPESTEQPTTNAVSDPYPLLAGQPMPTTGPLPPHPAAPAAEPVPDLARPPAPETVPPFPPAGRPNRTTLVALTIATVVFALVATIFTVLYANARGDATSTAAAVTEKERELAQVQGDQDGAARSLENNKDREAGLKSKHDLLTQCVDATKAYFKLPAGDDSPESDRLFKIMYDICPQI